MYPFKNSFMLNSTSAAAKPSSVIYNSMSSSQNFGSRLGIDFYNESGQVNRSELKSYIELKALETSNSMLTNYTQMAKSDVRNEKVKNYFDKSRQSYDDWEIRIQKIIE